jgi:hypothetical protein
MVTPKKREWRITKLLRLGVFCGAVSAVLGLVAARSVYGDVKVSALAVGHELGKLDDVGTGRPLRINGEPIFVASTTEDVPLDTILDRAEAGCTEHSAGVSAELDTLPPALRAQIPRGAGASGVLRERRGNEGVVACLVREEGRASTGMADTVARLSAMMSTGDLSRVGELRYIFAEKTASGRTHVVAAWTTGPFNLYAMLPERGRDAPGSDPAGAPRPPRSQRILTADVEGVPYGIRIYDSAAPPAEVIAHYDAEMASRGWERSVTKPVDGEAQRAYARPGADVLVLTQKDEGRTIVSLIEMRTK